MIRITTVHRSLHIDSMMNWEYEALKWSTGRIE